MAVFQVCELSYCITRQESTVYSLQYCTVYRMCHEVQKQSQITITILHNICTSVNNTTGCPSVGVLNGTII
jgi:hypothetical protein